MRMTHEISLKSELSFPADRNIGDLHTGTTRIFRDEVVSCVVDGVAVSIGDSACACIVHMYEETDRKVDSCQS